MPIHILMPALSPTMTEGNLVKWLKKEGDTVKAGEVLAEIETDKATMEVEAVDEGILGRILVPAGTEQVRVNSIIAMLLEEGEDASALNAEPVAAAPVKQEAVAPTEAPSSQSLPTSQPLREESARIFASPLARRLAQEKHLDLKNIAGTGPHGRIVKVDVEKAAGPVSQPSTSATSFTGAAEYVDIPLNNMRKVTAKRLTESKQQVPHFYLTVDCNLDALLSLRAELNARLDGEKLSVNDFMIRAVALTLIKVPEANSSWQDGVLRQYRSADIAVAVAIDGGLITPIIRAAHAKSLRDLSTEMKSLGLKARSGKLKPEEFQGGTFTISNLGMYGIKEFGAIINPPQACILAIGMGEQRPIVKEGTIQISTLATCTLSVDHRAVDGAVGATFLTTFKELIEDPLKLLI